MPSLEEIDARVRKIVVSPSPDVDSEIPRLVHEAQLHAEHAHSFAAMRGFWHVVSQLDSNVTVPGAGAMRSPTGPGADTVAYTFLRPRALEKPLRVEFPTLPDFTATTQFCRYENDVPADARIEWTLGSASGTSFTARGFKPGMVVIVTNFGSQTGCEWLDGVPLLIESISTNGWTIVTRCPEEGRPTGQTLYATLRFRVVWGVPTKTVGVDWIEGDDVARFYGAQTVDGLAKHVYDAAPDAIGGPLFYAYPKHTTVVSNLLIPCDFHLGPALDAPASDRSTANWFTNAAPRFLEWYAAAVALELEEDFEKAAVYARKAEAELKRLIRLDRKAAVKATAVPYSTGSRGTPTARNPRL